MNKLILTLTTLAVSISSFSQSNYKKKKNNIQQVREFEDNLNSIFIGFDTTKVAKDYFPNAVEGKEYYPIKFKRTNDPFFPELFVQYFYDEKTSDSMVVCASYDWNIMSYVKNLKDDGHHFDTEIKREKDYLQKYNEIKSNVISIFGKPDRINETKNADGYFYKLEWDGKDADVLILFSFSKKLQSVGKFKFGSYRIRVKIDYK
jgi:hypothetical protein